MMEKKKCRLWLPEHLLSCDPGSDLLLFGWYVASFKSVDVVVATATSSCVVSRLFHQFNLQEVLQSVSGEMPMALQGSTSFSLLGHCAAFDDNTDLNIVQNQDTDSRSASNSGQLQCLKTEPNTASGAIIDHCVNQQTGFDGDCIRWDCGCVKLDQFIEPHRQSLIGSCNWIQVLYKPQRIIRKGIRWLPEFHHIHHNGHILSVCDVHLIIYEPPIHGTHHFALSYGLFTKQVGTTYKKPNWVNELDKKPKLPDLDTVVLALNCTTAATMYYKRSLGTDSPGIHVRYRSILHRLALMVWHCVAVFVASISTVVYIVLQLVHSFLCHGSQMFLIIVLPKIFRHAWMNAYIRSCQIMYWPVFLHGSGFSYKSNVEYSHIAAMRKHFIWSSVVMDVLLGFVVGVAILANLDAVCSWILFVVRSITDNLLRSGCVWLMDVPAGFKLNTELAKLLGTIALNVIQVFSTLWFFTRPLLRHFIKGLACSGFVLGLTVPAALCIDILKLSTVHLLALHGFISFLYSRQIQALASLWRLFRGQKWNPLRQRLDSYDYSVEQHIVGSLLFTPLLLLLPTTSVFYIFFTMLNTTIGFICITIEITISTLHATPYAGIFIWITRRRRFPSGIWFEIALSASVSTSARVTREPKTLVCLLRSNYATIGQVIAPYYRDVFHGVSSFGASCAYKILSGQRVPSTLRSGLPPTMPWMHIGFRDYWRLCRSSVLACVS